MGSSNQDYKSRREAPFNGRESRGRGRPLFTKRLPLMEEHREPRFNHWRSQNQDSFRSYSPKMEPHQRRPIRPLYPHHRQSSRSPPRGSLSPRGRPFHGHPSDHRSPFQRRFPSHQGSSDRGSFRGHRRPPPFEDDQRDPRRDFGPRERTYDHPGHGTKRWNEPPLHNGPSGSQRSPRDMQGRGPCPERWSSEQDSRRHHGSMERQSNRSHSRESSQDDQHHQTHFRSPSWKSGPSETSSYNRSHPEGEMTRPRKRRISEISIPPSNPALEHDNPKLLRRERPQLFSAPRPFGGRPLSLREKSVLVKSRQMRAESLMAIKVRPFIKPNPPLVSSNWLGTSSAVLALRKKRFQSTVVPLKSVSTKRQRSESTSNDKGDSHSSSEESDTGKDQVEFRRSLKPHRSPPTEKRDLVVLSHWPPGPSTSKEDSPSKDHSPKSKSARVSTSDDDSRDERSPENRKRGYLDKRVFGSPFNVMQDRYRSGRPFRRPGVGMGSGSMQRPRYLGGLRKPPPPELSNFRRPLMESLVTRPFPNQRPMFQKSFSIMNKYRNMRVMRQRGPFSRGPSQRW
ncbi:uncharacterized protein si:ch211-114c12.2 isoform X2 [Synchiropus splendidus]|nr:uncharacterized protein si:ch211-114c12.2 isoform X2 [Synchiropus splendidus]